MRMFVCVIRFSIGRIDRFVQLSGSLEFHALG